MHPLFFSCSHPFPLSLPPFLPPPPPFLHPSVFHSLSPWHSPSPSPPSSRPPSLTLPPLFDQTPPPPHRKIKRCRERLDKELPRSTGASSERVTAIEGEVAALLRQAEREGEEGHVDKAQATMEKVSGGG